MQCRFLFAVLLLIIPLTANPNTGEKNDTEPCMNIVESPRFLLYGAAIAAVYLAFTEPPTDSEPSSSDLFKESGSKYSDNQIYPFIGFSSGRQRDISQLGIQVNF